MKRALVWALAVALAPSLAANARAQVGRDANAHVPGGNVAPGALGDVDLNVGVSAATLRPIDDRLFAAAAGVSGLAEITTSKLAMQHAGSQPVRDFARRMIQEHGIADTRLQALAAEKRIALPTTLDVQDQAASSFMAGLSGPDFDRAYLRHQILSHVNTIALFQTEATRGQDPQLRSFRLRNAPPSPVPRSDGPQGGQPVEITRLPGAAGRIEHGREPRAGHGPGPRHRRPAAPGQQL